MGLFKKCQFLGVRAEVEGGVVYLRRGEISAKANNEDGSFQ